MANHKSAAKRARQRVGRSLRNRLVLGSLRAALKLARTALAAGEAASAKPLVRAASVEAAKAASKGVIHQNAAARLCSRLELQLNKLSAA